MASALPVSSKDLISCLPGELASGVLDYLELRPCLVHISHLSTHWRTLVRNHPTFWRDVKVHVTDINVHSPSAYTLAVAQLQSSQNVGIVVKLDIKGAHRWYSLDNSATRHTRKPHEFGRIYQADIIVKFCSVLTQNLHRISSLSIFARQIMLLTMTHYSLFTTPAPQLEQLELKAYRGITENNRFTFRWSSVTLMPQLRSLRVHDIDEYPISIGDSALLSPHLGIHKLLLQRPARNLEGPGSTVDQLLERFPHLHTIGLLNMSTSCITAMVPLSLRLALFESITLSDELVVQLNIAQLSQVLHLRVNSASDLAIQQVLEHFLVTQHSVLSNGSGVVGLPPLAIEGQTVRDADWRRCPHRFTELALKGRRREFDVEYTWFPDIAVFHTLAPRVTRLAVQIQNWLEFFNALDGAPALEELMLHLMVQEQLDRDFCPVVQCPKLALLILQPAFEGESSFTVSANRVAAWVKRVISPELHGRAHLKLSRIFWEEPFEKVEELLGVYFERVDQ